MMYILDCNNISPQIIKDVFDDKIIEYNEDKYSVIEPSYKDLIPRSMLRRMGKGNRIGVGSALPLLNRNQVPEGIIIATTSNGLGECIHFLKQIEQYNEGTLTPTNFVQSTPNSISGLIALLSNNPCYNSTHVHFSNAFENALIDAEMHFISTSAETILLGDVEEISLYNYILDQKRNKFKIEKESNLNLVRSKTKGTVSGEGSSMFILSRKKENALALLRDVISIFPKQIDQLKSECLSFIHRNNLEVSDFDALVLGYNGNIDENIFYDEIADLFPSTSKIVFKHLSGEYATCSSFALYFSTQILLRNKLPSNALYDGEEKYIKRILIYNSFQDKSHNFIIVERP